MRNGRPPVTAYRILSELREKQEKDPLASFVYADPQDRPDYAALDRPVLEEVLKQPSLQLPFRDTRIYLEFELRRAGRHRTWWIPEAGSNVRILQVNKFYGPRGGTERVLYDLEDGLRERGHEIGLPQAMQPARHQVVHQVVAAGDLGEDLVDEALAGAL